MDHLHRGHVQQRAYLGVRVRVRDRDRVRVRVRVRVRASEVESVSSGVDRAEGLRARALFSKSLV